MKQDMIVILDLGSHENTVLARAIRALEYIAKSTRTTLRRRTEGLAECERHHHQRRPQQCG